jgi:hypothetical protein
MIFKLTAIGTHKMEKIIDVDDLDLQSKFVDRLLHNDIIFLKQEYGKKYKETCNKVYIEEEK